MADPTKPKYGKKTTETKSPKQKRFQSPEEMDAETGMQPDAVPATVEQQSAKTVTNTPTDKPPTAQDVVAPEATKDYSKGMTLEEAERMTPEQRRAVGLTDELYQRQSQKYQEVKGNFSNYSKGQHWVNTEASAKNNMFAGNTSAATDIAVANPMAITASANTNTVKPANAKGGDLRTQTRKEAMRAGTYYDSNGKAATYWDAKSQTRKMKDGTEVASAGASVIKPKGGSSKRSKSDFVDALNEQEPVKLNAQQYWGWSETDSNGKTKTYKDLSKTEKREIQERYYKQYVEKYPQVQGSGKNTEKMMTFEEFTYYDSNDPKNMDVIGKSKTPGSKHDGKLPSAPKYAQSQLDNSLAEAQAGFSEEEKQAVAKMTYDQLTPWDKFTSLYKDSQPVKPKMGNTETNSLKDAYNSLMLEANKNYNKDTGAGAKGWHEHYNAAEKLIGRPLTEDEKTEFSVKVSNGTQPYQALEAIRKKDLVPSEDYKRGVEGGKQKYINQKKAKLDAVQNAVYERSVKAEKKVFGKHLSPEEFDAQPLEKHLEYQKVLYGDAGAKNKEELYIYNSTDAGNDYSNQLDLKAIAEFRAKNSKQAPAQNPMQVKTDTVKPSGLPKWTDKTRSEGQKASLKEVRAELKQQKEQAYEMADAKEAFNTGLEFGRQEYKARKPIPENPDSDSGRVDEIKKLAKKEGYNIVSPMGVNRGTITYKPTGKSQRSELPKGVVPDSTGVVTLTVDEFESMRKASTAKKPSPVKPKKQPKK